MILNEITIIGTFGGSILWRRTVSPRWTNWQQWKLHPEPDGDHLSSSLLNKLLWGERKLTDSIQWNAKEHLRCLRPCKNKHGLLEFEVNNSSPFLRSFCIPPKIESLHVSPDFIQCTFYKLSYFAALSFLLWTNLIKTSAVPTASEVFNL